MPGLVHVFADNPVIRPRQHMVVAQNVQGSRAVPDERPEGPATAIERAVVFDVPAACSQRNGPGLADLMLRPGIRVRGDQCRAYYGNQPDSALEWKDRDTHLATLIITLDQIVVKALQTVDKG